ncbi:glycosyltransferase family 2 protein [Mucilaginibacter dorajii]|uniref:Glycosyltransferase 2-like domain-containing protein n=1 Tax=Mucilaginibacter dorajii TaxID=692994 RepID=A0ABP7R714_9SPHI|nr:glycosyltransferase family 2 protein [Mucilaginibacter dorajii]MCS3737414.1 glycosyltransferase involved in cell wall biosynthesis [Mucilaginibacter dorajii]
MKMSFVILTWNRYKFLEKCLEALTLSIADTKECEIVVMDNGSTDDTSIILDRYKDQEFVRIIKRDKNYGLNSYKKLFSYAKGDYIVVVDDDVLTFPKQLDRVFENYMLTFRHYGFIALNVIQDEFTNGAKPGPEFYTEEAIDDKVIEYGPTGGWCACFRKKDYRKLWFKVLFANLDMKYSEDGFLVHNFQKKLGLKSGIIKDQFCFHASGPYYAKQYGHLDREIAKYKQSGLQSLVSDYQKYHNN